MDVSNASLPSPALSDSLQSSPANPSSFGRRRHSNLSLDLSDLPPLTKPSPPSNTILITNLQELEIFSPSNLTSIHQAIQEQAPVYAFSPLKSLRRIICTFFEVEDAIHIRRILDGEAILGCRVRVYFGVDTPLHLEDQHLQAPKSQKQFFISPPPSPPMGWELRHEDPPNKDVHAEDLATALARLNARPEPIHDESLNTTSETIPSEPVAHQFTGRPRSGTGSFVVFDPQDHGSSPDLPAIAVEDTSASPGDLTPMDGDGKSFIHTARPPVELM